VPAILTEPALSHVEDLLTLEQRVHDDRPFLQRGGVVGFERSGAVLGERDGGVG
jgi:hypothetical protein